MDFQCHTVKALSFGTIDSYLALVGDNNESMSTLEIPNNTIYRSKVNSCDKITLLPAFGRYMSKAVTP